MANYTTYAGLTLYDGADTPKWRGNWNSTTNRLLNMTYNGDMSKIDDKLADLNTRVTNINAGTYIAKGSGAVATADIANGAVTTIKLPDITTGSETSTGVTGSKIASAAIIARHFGTGAVTRNAILDGEVIAGKLANNAVVAANIAASQIATTHLSTEATGALGTPAGVIAMWGGGAAPSGWLLCDGQPYNSGTNPNLATAIGQTFGPGGVGYYVPNLQGRVPVGLSTDDEFNILGESGGEKAHALLNAEMPYHTHTVGAHVHPNSSHTHPMPHTHDTNCGSSDYGIQNTSNSIYVPRWAPGTNSGASTAANTQAATVVTADSTAYETGSKGGGTASAGVAHNNIQPYLVVKYIIKAG